MRDTRGMNGKFIYRFREALTQRDLGKARFEEINGEATWDDGLNLPFIFSIVSNKIVHTEQEGLSPLI